MKIFLAAALSIGLLLTACGASYRDIAGKWEFSNLRYYDTAPEERMDPFEFDQIKDLFREMTYHFKDETHFTLVTPHLNKDTLKGTFLLENGDELVLKFKKEQKRYKIISLKEREMILKEMGTVKPEDKVEFIFTR